MSLEANIKENTEAIKELSALILDFIRTSAGDTAKLSTPGKKGTKSTRKKHTLGGPEAEAPEAEAPEAEAPEAEAPEAEAPEAEAPESSEPDEITADTVRGVFIRLVNDPKIGPVAAKKVITALGLSSIADTPKERLPELYDAAINLLNTPGEV